MRRDMFLSVLALLSLLFATLLGGCGSSKKEGASQGTEGVTFVGSQVCINCHSTTLATDVTGEAITAAWSDPTNTHTTVGRVECESCHGAGGNHWGVGPIPFPDPGVAQCEACHTDLTAFNTTAHNNQEQVPNSTFSQFFPGSDTITAGQHIQECSVCHNASQRIALDASGKINVPDPNNLPNPSVTCASCHDAHFAEKRQAIAQRTTTVPYPNFRQFFVDPTTFAQVNAGTIGGQNIRGFLFQANGAALPAAGLAPGTPVTPDYTKVVGTNNEVKPDVLCAACHTKGTYKNSGGITHQENVHAQWANSGHGTRNDPAFAEFSANPPAYINPNSVPPAPYPIGSHQTTYPIDMALSTFGTTARITQNAGNNNFACFKCHNGLTSLAWQDNVQGTSAAPVVFGDASVTCLTCHDPHADVPGQTLNTRKPVLMTQYSTTSVTISGNVFLDTQPIPGTTGNATICVYCHQGRESGFTLYKTKLAPGKNPAGQFFNPHYLGTGAMLWGANAYEYTGKSYSFNTAHQGANCTTCHMSNPTSDNMNGGHSWNPNVATCNTASCHGSSGLGVLSAETGTASPNLDTYRAAFDTNDYDGDGILEPIAVEIQHLQDNLITLLANNGIHYSDLNYPYAFSDAAFTTPFTSWGRAPDGLAAYKATFNLQFIIKGLPSASTSQTLVPNASAAVHDYKYIIQLLHDSYDDYNAVAPAKGAALGGVRPVGTRAATVYGPGQ